MNKDKRKDNLRSSYLNLRESHVAKNMFYLAGLDERNAIQEICFKYKIETPHWLVTSSDYRVLMPPDYEDYGGPIDIENELSLVVGVIGITKEKITYLKEIIDECRWAIHNDLQNKQYKKLLEVAEGMLDYLLGYVGDRESPLDEFDVALKTGPRDRRKKLHSDQQKQIAQKYLIKNRNVWKEKYDGNQDPFVTEKVIPHIIKELGISKDDCLSSRQLCQNLDWNKSK